MLWKGLKPKNVLGSVQTTLCHKNDACASCAGPEGFVDSCQNGILYILHLWHGVHTWNRSSHFVLCRVKRYAAGRDVKTSHTTWCPPHLDQILYHVAFYEEIRESKRAATWALNAWNFNAQGYTSLLRLSSAMVLVTALILIIARLP